MLNMCCWKDEIYKIKDYNKKILSNKIITIHIPMFENFYAKSYKSQNGFTFAQLIDRIHKASIQAATFYIQDHEEYHSTSPAEFMGEYAVTSSKNSSDILVKGRNIYVGFQH